MNELSTTMGGRRHLFMRLLALPLCLALLTTASPEAKTSAYAPSIVRVPVDSARDAQFLVSNFDDTHSYVPGHVELFLWPGDADELASLGYGDYVVVEDDVLERDIEAFAGDSDVVLSVPGPDRSDYRRLGDYVSEMRSLADKNPKLVRLLKLSEPTLEGRTVYGVEIAARVKAVDGRPTFHVDGIHHAREWPAAEYPMIFAHYLVENFGKDPAVTTLLKRGRVTIVPIVNPDGFDLSRESLTQYNQPLRDNTWPLGAAGLEGYWRKNRRSFTGLTVPEVHKNPDAYGVDVNRNYGYMWGDDEGGSSSTHATGTYRGEAPFSEPESRNIRTLVMSRSVTGLITNHTYGRLVLRPWGDTAADAPDERLMFGLGQKMADVMGGYRNIKGIQLYSTTGTTQDWAYGTLASLSYTFEHETAFHPAYSGIARQVPRVMQGFMVMGKAAINPKLHSVIQGRVVDGRGRPIRAKLTLSKSFQNPLWPGNPTGDPNYREVFRSSLSTTGGGTFLLHVNPSTRPYVLAEGKEEAYTLKIVPVGGGRPETKRIVVGRGDRVNLGKIKL